MFHRIARSALLLPGLTAAAVVLLGLALAGGASAASAPKPPTPISNTTCWGSLTPAPILYEPNLLSYQLHCDNPITGYTILGNRRAWDSGVIDDFGPTPVAMLNASTPDTRTSWLCEGSIPANGFNCNAGPGGSMAAWSIAEGTVDTVDPYCGTPVATSSKKKVKKRKSALSTPTYPPGLPRAIVQVVVTDSTGAEDGPFVLSDTAACSVKTSHHHHHHGASDR